MNGLHDREGARAVRLSTVLLAVSALVSCSSEPELVFADWTFPVPEGTPIKEYPPFPLEGRDGSAVQLVDDLVIGTDLTDEAAILYEPRSVVASEVGNIFVADGGAQDIKMFGPNGQYLKTLGKEGQGPGEFASISSLTIAGDVLVVNDTRNRRFSVWTLEGEHVADHAPEERRSATSMQGLADGTLVSYFTERAEDRSGERIVVRRTVEGDEITRYMAQPLQPPVPMDPSAPASMLQAILDSFHDPRMIMHVGRGEVLYLTTGHEYQVLAMSPDGDALWAMRVAWQRLSWPENQKQLLIDSMSEDFPDMAEISPTDLDWPGETTAVSMLGSDGAGRLYVFLTPDASLGTEPPDSWPVDVYSADGEPLAAGEVPALWSYARGDYVYGTRPDENEETAVVRYRVIVAGQ